MIPPTHDPGCFGQNDLFAEYVGPFYKADIHPQILMGNTDWIDYVWMLALTHYKQGSRRQHREGQILSIREGSKSGVFLISESRLFALQSTSIPIEGSATLNFLLSLAHDIS